MSILETRDLRKDYAGFLAVDGVDLEVARDSIHAVIGPNGAGKSTLFNLVTGLEEPSSGSILFDGEDITDLSMWEIARAGISRTFQIEDIFTGLTVMENVRLAAQVSHPHRDSFRRNAESITEVTDRAESILDDLELTAVKDQRAGDLSYGERRKIEIALGLATGPDLLLLDEPTAGMSRDVALEIIDLITAVKEELGFTVVIIEHNIQLVMDNVDVITVLHSGEVLAEGTPEEIQSNEAVQRAYIGGEL